ncbi:MAG TPA: hypothetical protein VFX30_01565 [bacterium]|nr:hypothetical protein [bacterium]
MTRKLRILSVLAALGFAGFVLHVSGPSGCAGDCGNNVLNDGEACDDGNTADGDGCNAACEVESGGTTGGGTTGGGTTGGTTGGVSGECTAPADCPDSFVGPSVCYSPDTCQGARTEATCIDGVCGSVNVPDDSACTADSFTLDCSPDESQSCDGTVAQVPPACEDCGDFSDNDHDGLTDCQDTVACPNNTLCAGGGAICFNGNCVD